MLDEGGTAIVTLTESLVFAQDGTYERCQLGSVTALLPLLVRETGTYEIFDAGQVRLTRQHIFGQQPDGSLQEIVGDPLEMLAFVTIDGDGLIFVIADEVDSLPVSERTFYLHHRFDCP